MKDYLSHFIHSRLRFDLGYTTRNGITLGLGQILASFSGLILTLGLVRFLDQAEYGSYNYILSLGGILSAFTLSGMDAAVAQSVAKGFTGDLHAGFKKKLYWSIPLAVCAAIVAIYYLYRGNELIGISLLVIAFTSPLLYASTLYTAYFNGKKQFKKIAHDNAWKNVAISVIILVVAYSTGSALYTTLAYLLSNTLISVARYFILYYSIKHGATQRDTLSLGTHLSAMEGLTAIAGYIDKIIVFQLLGATPLALYSIALAPVKQIHGISKIVKSLAIPKFSTRTERELRKDTPHKVLVFSLFSFVVIIMYWFLAELLFVKLFPQYEQALFYSQILSFSVLCIPSVLYVQALTALGKKRELYIVNSIKCITKIVLLIISVPFFKIWGAIIAFIGMHLVTLVTVAILFERSGKKQHHA